MGIKKKIFLLLLAVSIIPVLLLGLISINVLRQAIIQEAVHQLETIAVIRKNRIRNILSQYFENIHSFFGSSVFEKSLSDYDTHHSPSHAKKISGTFSLFNKLNSNFNQIVLVSPEGTVIASSDPKLIGTRNYNKESYDYGRNRENFEVSAVDRKNKSIFEYYSRPLFRTNRMMGVLIIECKIDSILALLNDHTGLGRTGETLMAERNKNGDALYLNTIRARPDLTTNLIISKTNKIIPINWALQKTNMVFLNGTDLNGRKVFAFTEYFSENDWGLVVKIDKSEIFSKMRYFEIVIFLIAVVPAAPIDRCIIYAHAINARLCQRVTRECTCRSASASGFNTFQCSQITSVTLPTILRASVLRIHTYKSRR